MDDTEYLIYITIGSKLPYEPLIALDDDEVRELRVKTPENKSKLFYYKRSLRGDR